MLRDRVRGSLVILATGFLAFGWATHPAWAESYRITITDAEFQPSKIYARVDQRVHITVYNGGTKIHNFILPAFYIFTANLAAKEKTTMEFVPDKRGRYPFFSDAGGEKEPGLLGEIDVR